MGGTKSKVDGSPDEESETSSKSSESTNSNTDYTQDERHRSWSPREKRRSGSEAPDKILDKPFRYRSRKDRLLDSLKADVSTDDDSDRKGTNVSVLKMVENMQANLNVKSVSSSSIRDIQHKTSSKNLTNDNNQKKAKMKSSSRTGSEVKPTGDEEKIIESLIQPRKRRSSLPRSIKMKTSAESVNVHTNPVEVAFDNAIKDIPKPPEPPPIDFSYDSFDERESRQPPKRASGVKLEAALSPNMSHLKELKLRFSNDVPRSPHEDNLNSTSVTEKIPSKVEKPLNRRESAPSKSYFTNNVPIADSLHILTDNPGSPKVVIRGAKDQERSTKHRKSREISTSGEPKVNTDNASELSKRKAESRPMSTSPKSILKNYDDDDTIKCFPVKTEYNEETSEFPKNTREHSRRSREKRKCANHRKTARTQTSSMGLVDSGVQTLPDLEHHARKIRTDEMDYDSVIDSKAQKVLRRVSMERSIGRKTSKDKKGRRFRNGSTQWEEIDLLDTSSCLILNENPMNLPVPQESLFLTKTKESKQSCRTDDSDCQNCYNGNEVCCMHLQVIPDTHVNGGARESRSRRRFGSDRGSKHKMTHANREEPCGGSCSGLSLDKLSAWATYSTSSGREHELSLLTPLRSTSTVRSPRPTASANKNQDLYRQMEELGLGFLRDGEWVPTDVISRTLWQNLEKCTENCQATWRRRRRSLSHN